VRETNVRKPKKR